MTFKSNLNPMFRSKFLRIFSIISIVMKMQSLGTVGKTLVLDVCDRHLTDDEIEQLTAFIRDMKFIPGGRYLYYAGRPNKFFNNCYLLRAEEDTREDWADLSWKAESCLMTGGGIGVDYSVYRAPALRYQQRTGKPIYFGL